MGAISPLHLILLLVVVLIVFGPGKLPEVGEALGRGMREFRKASDGIEGAMRGEPRAAQAPTETGPVANAPGDSVAKTD
jgi:sec-independent protein translocase protein TatA